MTDSVPAPKPRPLRVGFVLILSTLTIMAPLSIDMYLPALPAIAQAFGVGDGPIQLTLTSYFLGFALGQSFYGPVVDRFGRKPPLYIGMGLFALASFGCAMATSVEMLIGLRLLQALGACSGGVVSRAIVRDLFTPVEAARVYAALALVTGLGPLLAPMIGGYVLLVASWRWIFTIIGVVALILLTLVHFRLPESQRSAASIEQRAQAFSIGRIIGIYGRLLRDRHFLGFALCAAFPLAAMFTYVSGSPFVFIGVYDLPAEEFGMIFGANALMLMAGAQINGRIVGRYSPATILKWACRAQALAGLLLVEQALTGFGGFVGLMICIGAFTLCVGFIIANAMVMAMVPYGQTAGMASALLGTIQFVTGAIAATVQSLLPKGHTLPMAAGMAACGIAGVISNRFIVKNRADVASTS
jgi:DHA1 family bicyclomycin/chloramphenicol resistance-like MFS transporter